MLGTEIPSQNRNHGDIFSDLQLQLNFPPQQIATDRGDPIIEDDYYYQTQGITANGFYGGRISGKKWSAFVVACIDLVCKLQPYLLVNQIHYNKFTRVNFRDVFIAILI